MKKVEKVKELKGGKTLPFFYFTAFISEEVWNKTTKQIPKYESRRIARGNIVINDSVIIKNRIFALNSTEDESRRNNTE